MTEIGDLLRREEVRLVTLTGPGGIGKTRLGQEVAAALLDDFPDGVYFVPLAPVSDPSLLPSAIAASLRLRSADHLLAHLRERQALLLLDNFEHLLAGARVVTEVLTTCPSVKLLVTSRALLRVSGERNFPVPPLPLPDARRLPTAEGLIDNAAVRLFVERATAASRGFRLTGENASAIAEVCSRLDGLPLAIELAAARTRVLDPAALLTRLERRLQVLTGGARDLPERQQTLRAAISWSYDLLRPDERTLFRRLAVFRGPFSVEAVDAVCNAEGELGDTLDGVSALLDNSLLQQRSSSPSTGRFLMLESIREFAWEKLEDAAEMATIRDAHLRYVLVLIDDMTPRMTTADMPRVVTQFLVELDNVRAALDWATLHNPEAANRLRQALSSFHRQRAYLVPW